MTAFLTAGLLGLTIAMPVGPMALLILRRVLTVGVAAGIATALGVASADAAYAALAAFGLSALSAGLLAETNLLALAGGSLLIYLGIRGLIKAGRVAGDGQAPADRSLSAGAAYGSALLLTLSNPLTIFGFAGAFAAIGLTAAGDRGTGLIIVSGIAAGSTLWQLALVVCAQQLRRRLSAGLILWLDRLSGALLIGFGVLALSRLLV